MIVAVGEGLNSHGWPLLTSRARAHEGSSQHSQSLGKDALESEERQVLISQRGIARVARDMRGKSRITKTSAPRRRQSIAPRSPTRSPCIPKDDLDGIETVRRDLIDPVDSSDRTRLRTLTHRQQRFQSERNGRHRAPDATPLQSWGQRPAY